MLRRHFLAVLLLAAFAVPAFAQSPTDADASVGRRPLVFPPSALAPADSAFGYDTRYSDPADRGFATFQLNSGAFASDTLNVLAPDGALVQGCDFDDLDFEQMLCISGAGQFFRVGLKSGAVDVIGTATYPGVVSDLTYSVAEDAWFALASTCSESAPADDRSALFRIDPATGAASAVGSGTDTSFCGLGLAAAPDSALYAYSAQTNAAVSRSAQIDSETGVFAILGPTGLDAYYAQAMDCDASDGACYAFGYLGSGVNGLYRLSPDSGFLTSFGDLLEGAEFTAAAIATSTTMSVSSDVLPSVQPALRVLSATPARGTLRLAVGAAPDGLVLDVTDALGRRVTRRTVQGADTVTLDVSRWAPGLYVLRLWGDGVTASRTVTVVR